MWKALVTASSKIAPSLCTSSLLILLCCSSVASAERWRVGDFSTFAHDIAGTLYVVSEHILEVDNFVYDGAAPASYFWASTDDGPSRNGLILADAAPTFGCAMAPDDGKELPSADGTQTFRVEFPIGVKFSDYLGGSISVWCETFEVNFGHVSIPSDFLDVIALPDDLPRECFSTVPDITVTPDGFNCEELNNQLQVRWQVDESNNALNVQLLGQIEDGTYIGFGISGRETETFMLGADAVVANFNGDTPIVRDFYLDNRSRCSGGQGVCPDTATTGLTNDASNVSGSKRNGLSLFEYTRPLSRTNTQLVAGNLPSDRPISTTPGDQTFILWAMGPVSEDGLPLFHTSFSWGGESSVSLDFGRAVADNCESLLAAGESLSPTPTPPPPFTRPDVGDDELIITAHIGPSGGPRGYQAIAGRASWGIAWYLNGMLVPRVIMRRGRTYTFRVNGGDDPNAPPKFHPFYITDSPKGGYSSSTLQERAVETVFAGIDFGATATTRNALDNFTATAIGPICEYKASALTEATELLSYDEYASTLERSCTQDPAIIDNAAILTFTPDADTPDTLYYHCVTHPSLGYEISIIDDVPATTTTTTSSATVPATTTTTTTTSSVTVPAITTTTTSSATVPATTTTTITTTSNAAATTTTAITDPVPTASPTSSGGQCHSYLLVASLGIVAILSF